MKKIFYVFLMLGCLSVFSQKTGFKGGLNIGNEKSTKDGVSSTVTAKVSIMLGAYTEIKLDDKLFFSPEIIFSVDGGKSEVNGTTIKDNFSYLSFPFLLKYDNGKFGMHAGPQLGFLLKAEAKNDKNKNSVDISSFVKNTNFSFVLGGEVNLNAVSLGLRSILGLSDITNDDAAFQGIDYKLNTVQIYMAVPIKF